MLKITDIELKKTFRGTDYHNLVFQTTLEVQVGARYNRSTVALTDEQTASIVDFILAVASEGTKLELERPGLVAEIDMATVPVDGAVALAVQP